MSRLLEQITRRSLVFLPLDPETILKVFQTESDEDIFQASHLITRRCASRVFDVCTIVNAKSGHCTEDCHWCAQSRHWPTDVNITPIIPADHTDKALDRAEQLGIKKFSFVTSGRKLSKRETEEIRPRITQAASRPSLQVCGSFGLMDEAAFRSLKAAGLHRVHCNLETGEAFFPSVCTTHTQQEKIATLKAALRADLEICSGGLFGIGERFEDRVELAFRLRKLSVPSIPLNFLTPIPGTPLADAHPLSPSDILRTVALVRVVNPGAYLRFAGGLGRMSRATIEQGLYVGMNSAIVGDFLTTSGLNVKTILELAENSGYRTGAS